MYPFMKLGDDTEIVHSELLENETVKVYIEKPILGGFCSATCYLPEYQWSEINGFADSDIDNYQEILESTAHLIIRFAQDGGFNNAANF
jgi:hypothetical protein